MPEKSVMDELRCNLSSFAAAYLRSVVVHGAASDAPVPKGRAQTAPTSKFDTHPFATVRGVTSEGSDASRTLRSPITATFTGRSALFGGM